MKRYIAFLVLSLCLLVPAQSISQSPYHSIPPFDEMTLSPIWAREGFIILCAEGVNYKYILPDKPTQYQTVHSVQWDRLPKKNL